MVQVGVVNVPVPHRRVAMPVGVGLGHGTIVVVVVMPIVDVAMLVAHRLVRMFVVVPFREVEP